MPPLRRLIMPDTKSWTAPAKMLPNAIQRNAAGPNITPMMAPKIGPKPAILRNWMRKTLQAGISIKSMPSAMVLAGVGRAASVPKIFSTIMP